MSKQLLLLICLAAGNVSAATWKPADRLLHAVRHVESAEGLLTVGDNGRSLGEYQLSEAAWLDVDAWRKARGLTVYKYQRHVWDKNVSREYAANYLSILYGSLKRRLNRQPNAAEVYAAYNMGIGSFAQCQFKLANVNPTTARRCAQVKAMAGGR